MADYIDGYVFPIPTEQLDAYQKLASAIAAIWLEHGALAYREGRCVDPDFPGTADFPSQLACGADETIVFGWIVFPSREARDAAHERVAADPRVAALMAAQDTGFDASRMVYGGFRSFVEA